MCIQYVWVSQFEEQIAEENELVRLNVFKPKPSSR
jgi:hypothetical protein